MAHGRKHLPTAGVLRCRRESIGGDRTDKQQGIASFYPSKQQLRAIAERIVSVQAVENIAERWNLPLDQAIKLVKLALFDVVIYVDDSASMERMEGGQRVQQLHNILSQIAFCTALLDDDGIDIEFINAPFNGKNIRNADQVHDLLFRVQYKYNTRLGTQMRAKILDPFVRDAQRGQLKKPLVLITITDGEPQGEPRNMIYDVILKADKELRKTRYGRDAISYQFAQVGNDRQAQDFLGELDEDRRIGDLVDCTSRYELEAEEWMRKTQSPLSREEWLAKLLLGPVDTSYDGRDETLNEANLGGGLAPNLKRGSTMKKLKGLFR